MLNTLKKYRATLFDDMLAGLTGAVAGAPQAMGFAILAGVSPLYGLYAAFITSVVSSLLSSSQLLVFAPTNALALVAGSAIMVAPPDKQLDVLFLLSILTGIFLLLIGLFRLGNMTRFVSNAVMTGFITGAGLLIMLGQLHHLNNYDNTESSIPLVRVWDWFSHLHLSDYHTTMIGVASIVIIWGLHHTRFKSYATLFAMIVLTIFISVAGWDDVPDVRELSEIPRSLPLPFLPDVLLAPSLVSAAFAMSILAAIQSAALMEATQEDEPETPNPSRDFMAMGVGNIVGGFFQGMPSCASLSRTAVNISAGGKTRLSNISAGLFIGLILVAAGDLIERIPLAVLAGHLVVAAASLIKPGDIWMVWRVGGSAKYAMLVTFAATMLLPLENSIYIGVGLSLLLYVYTSAGNLTVVQLQPNGDGHYRRTPLPEALPHDDALVISVNGNLYFAAVRRLREVLPDPATANNTVVILRIRDNQYFGTTGIRALGRYAEQLRDHNSRFVLSGVNPHIRGQLNRAGGVAVFGEENIFEAGDVVFASTERAMVSARQWLQRDVIAVE